MRSCLIVTGGRLDMAFARCFLNDETFDKVIAVDAGLEAAEKLGIVPDYVVGDFDTVSDAVVEYFKRFPFIVWKHHKPEKNETDTELARSLALTLHCTRIVFLGATGGRLDHMLGNIHALKGCMEHGIDASLVDRQNRLYLLDKGKTFKRSSLWGSYVSFLPYSDKVTGITLEGFKYPLNRKDLQKGEEVGLCISNELTGDCAVLNFETGILLCVESKDENWTG